MGRYSDEEWRAITSADCIRTAQALGLEFDEKRSDAKAIHIKGYGGLYVWRSGNGWYQHSSGEYGHAVELVQKFTDMSYREALDFINDNVLLEQNAGTKIAYTYSPPPDQGEPKKEKTFELPEKADNDKRVFAYLTKARCIDPTIVRYALKNKLIYQEAVKGNCCFVGYDKDNNPKYCTKRGTNSNVQFRGEVGGSDKKIGWKMTGVGENPRLYIFEAPIDAMSHASIYLWNGMDWKKDTRLALGGCSPLALETELANRQYKSLIICSDNDAAGNQLAEKIKEQYGDEYKVVRKTPLAKDWNEDLTNMRDLEKLSFFGELSKKGKIEGYYDMGINTVKWLLGQELNADKTPNIAENTDDIFKKGVEMPQMR